VYRGFLEVVITRLDALEENRKPTPVAWVVRFIESLCLVLNQEEIVIEAASPTQKAVMLQSRQQRRQAVWMASFMTDANVNRIRSDVKPSSLRRSRLLTKQAHSSTLVVCSFAPLAPVR
jgi:hypothetical protein